MATALERYARLEALGLWRETPDDPGREVVVAFGAATLVLSDVTERPLGHWALAGVSALRREGGATVFSMTPDGDETLAIRDPEMIAAIAAVSRHGTAPSGRSRRWWRWLRRAAVLVIVAGVVAGVAVVAAPRALPTAARSLVPPGREGPLADALLAAIVARAGTPPCAGAEDVLARVATAIDPIDPPTLRVVDLGGKPLVALPGRTLLLDRGALGPEDRDPIAALARAALGRDATMAVLQAAGPAADLRFAATGRFSDADLSRIAGALLSGDGAESIQAETRPKAGIPAADWFAAGNFCR